MQAKQQNVFKSNLNQILKKGRYKSKEQKSTLENIKFFTNQEKLLSSYLMNIL